MEKLLNIFNDAKTETYFALHLFSTYLGLQKRRTDLSG
jgi:hypothetical protein